MQVLPCLATQIGLNEAIVLQQLHWVLQNPAMGKVVDGNKYVYMSYSEWRVSHFPFWSEATIQRAFNSLEESKLVVSRNDLNKAHFDRTKWYSIDQDKVKSLEEDVAKNEKVKEHNRVIDEHSKMKDGRSKMKNASSQDDGTIPDASLPDASPDTFSPDGENTPTGGEIEFGDMPPRETHPNPLVETQESLSEFGRTGGKPAVSDATLSEKQFVKEYAPILAEICGWAKPIGDANSAAKRLYKLRLDKERMDDRLRAYRNGEGKQFRKPDTSAHYVVIQVEKDLAERINKSDDDEARVRAALSVM